MSISKLDNLLRKRIRKTLKQQLMMRTLLRNKFMKKFINNQSQLQNQLLLKPPQLKLIGLKLTLHNHNNLLINHYIHHSPLAILKLLIPFQITSHHPKKTLLKVDMLQFFLLPLLNKNLCMQSMRISLISTLFILTPKVSDYSLKIQVLVWEKWDNLMKVLNKWLISILSLFNS